MKHADHAVQFKGIAYETPMFELVCLHADDDNTFYTDLDGNEYDDCLLRAWWDELRTELLWDNNTLDENGRLLCWTAFNLIDFDGTPVLVSRERYKEEFG